MTTTTERPRWRKNRQLPYGLYVAPAWLLLLGVVLVPFILGVWTSTRNTSLLSPTDDFVGTDNYTALFGGGDFWQALLVTAVISVLSLAIQLPIGFLIAVVIHRELRGTIVFRSALLLPMLLTPVAVGLMWRLMMNIDNGVIAGTLRTFGLPAIDWLGDKNIAILSIVLVDSWQNIPFVMLLLLAGLQSLPASPLEAARVDGANTAQLYRHIILPLLAPVSLVVVMIRVVESIKLFDIIYILTSGGPGTATQNISLLAFRTGFTFLQTSSAAALGVVILIGLTPVYLLWRRANRA